MRYLIWYSLFGVGEGAHNFMIIIPFQRLAEKYMKVKSSIFGTKKLPMAMSFLHLNTLTYIRIM